MLPVAESSYAVLHTRLWNLTRALLMVLGGLPSLLTTVVMVLFTGSNVSEDLKGRLLGWTVSLAVAGIGTGWAAARWLVRPRMEAMMQKAQTPEQLWGAIDLFTRRVQSGDLSGRVEFSAADEAKNGPIVSLAKGMNAVVAQLQTTLHQIQSVAENAAKVADDILTATNEQIATVSDQDASVMQTSSTVQEVRATVTETAERAAAVAQMAQNSVQVSKTGEQAVTEAINGMALIRQRVEGIADNILVLSEHTQQIGEIIATVSALADQSKLLALNASVEAARAGEEGKGFAVVAMEVRNLAEQSREATAQVRDILSEIQQATNSAVMVTEEGTKGVDAGVQLVNSAGESIRGLAKLIEEAAYAAVQIAASTRQQAVGMDQLSAAMNRIRQATGQTNASTMAVERAARDLGTMARKLNEMVQGYRT
ncbi:MAG: hypothetical protein K8L91_14845 [Anaerolineae bacterium]|nr:hypothetical protein [Anaerolineae bacterium]